MGVHGEDTEGGLPREKWISRLLAGSAQTLVPILRLYPPRRLHIRLEGPINCQEIMHTKSVTLTVIMREPSAKHSEPIVRYCQFCMPKHKCTSFKFYVYTGSTRESLLTHWTFRSPARAGSPNGSSSVTLFIHTKGVNIQRNMFATSQYFSIPLVSHTSVFCQTACRPLPRVARELPLIWQHTFQQSVGCGAVLLMTLHPVFIFLFLIATVNICIIHLTLDYLY